MNTGWSTPVLPFRLMAVFCLLFFFSGSLSAQMEDNWEAERTELLEEYRALLSQDGGSKRADSILIYVHEKSILKKDTIGQMKALVGKINLHLNNEHITDSLCDYLLPIMPDDDHKIWNYYYRFRSYACSNRGDYNQQTVYLDSAVARSTMSGDSTITSYTHVEISLAYQDVQNYEAALASGRDALKSHPSSGLAQERAYAVRNIGICHHKREDLDSALHYYSEARKAYSEIGNTGEEMYTYALVGRVEHLKENYGRAKDILEEVAETLFSPSNNSYTLAAFNYIYVWLAETYIAVGDQAEAIKNARIAFQVTDSLNQEVNRIQALKVLIKAELDSDSEIQDHFEEYVEAKNELYRIENAEAILEFERKYKAKEAEQKVLLLERKAQEDEIEMQNTRFLIVLILALVLLGSLIAGILALRNRIRTRQKIDELNLKALQLQINPHFFFNVLNSISNFIGRNDQKSAHFFLTRFAKLMRQTLEYSRENWVELEKELDFLKNYLALEQLRNDKFDYEIDCPEELLKKSVPPMLLQPFAENCVVHAFSDNLPERGKIKISAKELNGGIQVQIEDNGKGISVEKTPSKDTEKTSLAISILDERLSIYGKKGGDVSIEKAFPDRVEAPGTRVVLQIPYK